MYMISPSRPASSRQPGAFKGKDLKLCLLVQINIKHRQSGLLKIDNIYDSQAIDRQVHWFITTHRLRQEAFPYIKSIIDKKIQVQKAALKAIPSGNLSTPPSNKPCQTKAHHVSTQSRTQKEQTFPLKHREKLNTSPARDEPPAKIERKPCQVSLRLNIPANDKHSEESMVFDSSFSIPSSMADRDNSFVADQMFENEFNTGKFSADFSTINELNKNTQTGAKLIYPPLSMKGINQNNALTDANNQKAKRQAIKIYLGKRENGPRASEQDKTSRNAVDVAKIGQTSSTHRLSTKEEKSSLLTTRKERKEIQEQFEIYSCHHKLTSSERQTPATQQLQSQDQKQEYQLALLFQKLTKNNPHQVDTIHSQYVSYQELTKEQLFLMGTLFERIDPEELNALNYVNFRSNILKYCFQELLKLNKSNSSK